MRVLMVQIATQLSPLVTVSTSCIAQGSPQALASLVLDRFQVLDVPYPELRERLLNDKPILEWAAPTRGR